MVRYHRHHQLIRKGGEPMKDEVLHNENIDSGYNCKRTRSRLFSLFFLTLLSCCFVLAPSFIGFSFNIPHFCKFLSSLLPLFSFSVSFSFFLFSFFSNFCAPFFFCALQTLLEQKMVQPCLDYALQFLMVCVLILFSSVC